MMTNESKNERFKRLAKLRGERLLKDITLLGNLSNRNNYQYSDSEISRLFYIIETELRAQKSRFHSNRKKEIKF